MDEDDEGGVERLREMERAIWTFGSGGRGCVGKWLAVLEMKLLVVGIYNLFRTEIDDETGVNIGHE